tara:strand:- start:776 stop:1273 length:498 start_codon:yes stop_codon:yes gene_type:complete
MCVSLLSWTLPRPFDNPKVLELFFVNAKFEHGTDLVKARDACGSGVQVEATPSVHTLHEQNVAVSANEEVGLFFPQLRKDASGVLGRSPADVGHPDLQSTCFEALVFRPGAARKLVIDVSVDCPDLGDVRQGIGHMEVPNVPGMPHFVAAFDVPFDAVVDVAMGV